MMRILVTSSRDWQRRDVIWVALDTLAATARAIGETVTVVHGCARGGDTHADDWVRDRKARGWPVEAERHPADWARHRRRAGRIRNAEMVDRGADVCLTAINPCSDRNCRRADRHGSHGATHCAELAAARDIRLAEAGMAIEDALGIAA